MRLGLVASAAWLVLEEGLSDFAFAAGSHEGAAPARTRATLRVRGSCSSCPEVAHATTMSKTAAKGRRLTRAACVGVSTCIRQHMYSSRMTFAMFDSSFDKARAVLCLSACCAIVR